MAQKMYHPRLHRSAEPSEDLDRFAAHSTLSPLQPSVEYNLPQLNQAVPPHSLRQLGGVLRERALTQLQQTIGNHAVQRTVDRSRSTANPR